MSIENKEPVPATLIGKVIHSISSGCDDSGYGFVEFRFTDGTMFNVREIGQTGEIKWYEPSMPTWPREDEYGFTIGGSNANHQ